MEFQDKLTEILSKKIKVNNKTNRGNLDRHLATACRQFFTQRVEFHPARSSDSHLEHLKSRYKPLNRSVPHSSGTMEGMETAEGTPMDENVGGDNQTTDSNNEQQSSCMEGVPKPRTVLFDGDKLVMEWKNKRSIGAGLSNMGNTCFLNSVLQCLTYTPPLWNYLQSGHHKQKCKTQGFCALCELQRHCTRVFNANGSVKPVPIVQNLKVITKHFRQGRQEDAHEFLRYFVDSLQKSCLQGLPSKMDPHSKATTAIHQIFGGYHRSQVKCLECMKTSNTYDPLLDINLDISLSNTLVRALQKHIKPDLLDGENSYACPFCKKMTKAEKYFTIQRLPRVLTIQLKRFNYNSLFGGKVNKQVAYVEHLDMRPYMSERQGPPEWYKLYGVLVHFGYSCHSGHYYCYIKNSNGIWHCMNDSQVTQVSLSTVMQQEAYLLFYIKDENYKPPKPVTPPQSSSAYKQDPNFLGTSIKRPSVGVDKTGTPLVRRVQKPTGVVTPSPQAKKNTTKPEEKATPSQQKENTMKNNNNNSGSKSNTNANTTTSNTSSNTPTTNTITSSGRSSSSSPPNGSVRNFSIPLRKTNIPSTSPPKKQTESNTDSTVPPPPSTTTTTTTEQPAVSDPPPSAAIQPAKGATAAVSSSASLVFTPRQIAAPPKPKKVSKNLSISGATKVKHVEVSISPKLKSQDKENRTESGEGIPIAQSIASHQGSKTILDYADVNNAPSTPGFIALTEGTREESDTSSMPSGFNRPVSPSTPSNPIRLEPFSLKPSNSKNGPKVARVTPQRHSTSKPVAMVKPSPHIKTSSTSDERRKAGEVSPTPSTPHPNATTPWKVVANSGSSNKNEFDSPAHGWKVTPMKSGDDSGHGRVKKHKKKKKKHHRYSTSEYSSDSEESENSPRRERKSKRSEKTRKKRYDSESDRTRGKHRDVSYSPNTPPKYKKYMKHRHAEKERDRDTRKRGRFDSEGGHRRTQRHKRRHTYRSRSRSWSRSRSRSRSRSQSRSGDSDSDYDHNRRTGGHYHHRSRYRSPLSSRKQSRHHKHYSESGNSAKKRPHSPRSRSRSRSPDYRKRSSKTVEDSSKRVKVSNARKDHYKERESVDLLSNESRDRKRPHSSLGHHREHEHKRHKSDGSVPEDLHQNRKINEVPVVEWDSTDAKKVHSKWDGAQHSFTVEQLISHSHDKLGENVKSWDGSESVVDSSVMPEESQKRVSDPWDKELDRGKVKKVKKKKEEDFSRNQFQSVQNKRNKEVERIN